MSDTFFDGLDELYHHAKVGEDRTMRAGCRFENVVFVFFVCHATSRAYYYSLLRRKAAQKSQQ